MRRAVVDCIEVAPVIVGCSGGPDSLALVASASWAVPSVGHEVHVVIVDHGLQADSARVAHNAGDIVRQWGIDNVVIERVQVGTQGDRRRRPAQPAGLRSRTLRRSAALTRYFLPTPEKIKLRPSSCGWHADREPGPLRP